ncbi:hypothetical protein LT697_21760 [Pseudomonas syringae pv. syringae]|nr:hypothetical protein [Pseudomonas syringae]MCK9744157.1 hypothetical protein [Pseudomonas syringae pv. syringae]
MQTPDGQVVRKGTIGAFLVNAQIWGDPHTTSAAQADVERDIIGALPALRSLGLFDICTARNEALQRLIEAH